MAQSPEALSEAVAAYAQVEAQMKREAREAERWHRQEETFEVLMAEGFGLTGEQWARAIRRRRRTKAGRTSGRYIQPTLFDERGQPTVTS